MIMITGFMHPTGLPSCTYFSTQITGDSPMPYVFGFYVVGDS